MYCETAQSEPTENFVLVIEVHSGYVVKIAFTTD